MSQTEWGLPQNEISITSEAERGNLCPSIPAEPDHLDREHWMLTYLLIGINVLVSLIGFSRMNRGRGETLFVFSPSEVSAGRNYQGMLLSHFAHADSTHLLFNML